MAKTLTSNKKRTAFTTTVFMKRMMAISGFVFLFFVAFHAYGNLHYFQGEVEYDHYAVFLRTLLSPILPYEGFLWILRITLVLCVLAHVFSAYYLWARNRRARGSSRYAVKVSKADSYASRYAMRTMRWGGTYLLLFIIVHILQFTTLTFTPGKEYVHGRAYFNMYWGFQLWWVYLIYVLALVALCLHLWHGIWSALQTLGAIRKNTIPGVRIVAFLVAFAVFASFIAVPTAILFGMVDAPMSDATYYPQLCKAVGSAAEHVSHCAAMTH